MNDGSLESEIAAARSAVEELARDGRLSVRDRDTVMYGLDALAGQAARHRAEESRDRKPPPKVENPWGERTFTFEVRQSDDRARTRTIPFIRE